jgi:hypothetical protein
VNDHRGVDHAFAVAPLPQPAGASTAGGSEPAPASLPLLPPLPPQARALAAQEAPNPSLLIPPPAPLLEPTATLGMRCLKQGHPEDCDRCAAAASWSITHSLIMCFMQQYVAG